MWWYGEAAGGGGPKLAGAGGGGGLAFMGGWAAGRSEVPCVDGISC